MGQSGESKKPGDFDALASLHDNLQKKAPQLVDRLHRVFKYLNGVLISWDNAQSESKQRGEQPINYVLGVLGVDQLEKDIELRIGLSHELKEGLFRVTKDNWLVSAIKPEEVAATETVLGEKPDESIIGSNLFGVCED